MRIRDEGLSLGAFGINGLAVSTLAGSPEGPSKVVGPIDCCNTIVEIHSLVTSGDYILAGKLSSFLQLHSPSLTSCSHAYTFDATLWWRALPYILRRAHVWTRPVLKPPRSNSV